MGLDFHYNLFFYVSNICSFVLYMCTVHISRYKKVHMYLDVYHHKIAISKQHEIWIASNILLHFYTLPSFSVINNKYLCYVIWLG